MGNRWGIPSSLDFVPNKGEIKGYPHPLGRRSREAEEKDMEAYNKTHQKIDSDEAQGERGDL